MVITGSRTIRNRAYQWFIAQHAILWLFLVAALALHQTHQQWWIWAGHVVFPSAHCKLTYSFVLFCLDGSGRLARIVVYHFVRPVKKEAHRPMSSVTVLSADTVRVSVRTRASEFVINCDSRVVQGLQVGSPANMSFYTAPVSHPADTPSPVRRSLDPSHPSSPPSVSVQYMPPSHPDQ